MFHCSMVHSVIMVHGVITKNIQFGPLQVIHSSILSNTKVKILSLLWTTTSNCTNCSIHETVFSSLHMQVFCAYSLRSKISSFLQFDYPYSKRTKMRLSLLCKFSSWLLKPQSRLFTHLFFFKGQHPPVIPEELGVTCSYKTVFDLNMKDVQT